MLAPSHDSRVLAVYPAVMRLVSWNMNGGVPLRGRADERLGVPPRRAPSRCRARPGSDPARCAEAGVPADRRTPERVGIPRSSPERALHATSTSAPAPRLEARARGAVRQSAWHHRRRRRRRRDVAAHPLLGRLVLRRMEYLSPGPSEPSALRAIATKTTLSLSLLPSAEMLAIARDVGSPCPASAEQVWAEIDARNSTIGRARSSRSRTPTRARTAPTSLGGAGPLSNA